MMKIFLASVCMFLVGCAEPGAVFSEATKPGAVKQGPECPLVPGTQQLEIRVDGTSRSYWLTVGPRAGQGPEPAPLVFLWHGWGGSARTLSSVLDPARLWPEAVTIAPVGLRRRFPGLPPGKMPGWQIAAGEFDDRDLKLFDALKEQMTSLSCIDAQRVYSTGFSNGGYFSNLLGCQRPDAIAAIAPVSGGGPLPPYCEGEVAVQVMHGKRDRVVRYAEGESSFEAWRRVNGCTGEVESGDGPCAEARGCREEVRMCSYDGGHVWPRELNQELVSFLKRHRSSEPVVSEPVTLSE